MMLGIELQLGWRERIERLMRGRLAMAGVALFGGPHSTIFSAILFLVRRRSERCHPRVIDFKNLRASVRKVHGQVHVHGVLAGVG